MAACSNCREAVRTAARSALIHVTIVNTNTIDNSQEQQQRSQPSVSNDQAKPLNLYFARSGQYRVHSGQWAASHAPPERLVDGIEGVWASESNGFATGTAGEAEYDCVLENVFDSVGQSGSSSSTGILGSVRIGKVKFVWDFPFSLLKSSKAVVETKRAFPELALPFEVQSERESSRNMHRLKICEHVELIVRIVVSQGALERIADYLRSTGPDAVAKIDSDLVGSIDTAHHNKAAHSAGRACEVTVRNSLDRLILQRTTYEDEVGRWGVLPPEVVFPASEYTFGTKNAGPTNGTRGFVCFNVVDGDLTPPSVVAELKFTWNNPFHAKKKGQVFAESKIGGPHAHLVRVDITTRSDRIACVLFDVVPVCDATPLQLQLNADSFVRIISSPWSELDENSQCALCISAVCASLCPSLVSVPVTASLVSARGESRHFEELCNMEWGEDAVEKLLVYPTSSRFAFLRRIFSQSTQWALPEEWNHTLVEGCRLDDRVHLKRRIQVISKGHRDYVLKPVVMLLFEICSQTPPSTSSSAKRQPAGLRAPELDEACLRAVSHIFGQLLLPPVHLPSLDSLDCERARSATMATLIRHSNFIFGHFEGQVAADSTTTKDEQRASDLMKSDHIRAEIGAVEDRIALIERQLDQLNKPGPSMQAQFTRPARLQLGTQRDQFVKQRDSLQSALREAIQSEMADGTSGGVGRLRAAKSTAQPAPFAGPAVAVMQKDGK